MPGGGRCRPLPRRTGFLPPTPFRRALEPPCDRGLLRCGLRWWGATAAIGCRHCSMPSPTWCSRGSCLAANGCCLRRPGQSLSHSSGRRYESSRGALPLACWIGAYRAWEADRPRAVRSLQCRSGRLRAAHHPVGGPGTRSSPLSGSSPSPAVLLVMDIEVRPRDVINLCRTLAVREAYSLRIVLPIGDAGPPPPDLGFYAHQSG